MRLKFKNKNRLNRVILIQINLSTKSCQVIQIGKDQVITTYWK